MTSGRAILGVALADFRERSRTLTLLVVPILIAYFVKLATVDSTLYVADSYTGTPNAAWFGGVVAGIATLVFFLFGYPLVSGSVARDRETGVGQLLAASPLSNTGYLLGKWLSNVAVLVVATAVLVVATLVSFLLQGTGPIDVVALVSPFLLLTLPTMTVVAAAAVCFETVRLLRGTLGSVVYFVGVLALTVASIPPDSPLDFTGLVALRESMGASIAAQYPEFTGPVGSFAYSGGRTSVQTFTWRGLKPSLSVLSSRMPVLAATGVLLALATRTFDRFDGDTGSTAASSDAATSDAESVVRDEAAGTTKTDAPTAETLSSAGTGGFSFLSVLWGELRLALRGRARWWSLTCIGAIVACTVAPLDIARTLVVPVALLLALTVWGDIGARERRHRTGELVFVTGGPVRLLTASYLVGAVIGGSLVAPALVRFGAAGAWPTVAGIAAGVLFLPAAGAALGVWSARPRVFELGYLVVWYLGPMNDVRPLDYLATHATGFTWPLVYLGLAVIAFGVAAVGRHYRWG